MAAQSNFPNAAIEETLWGGLVGHDMTTTLGMGTSLYCALHYNSPGGLGTSQAVNEISNAPPSPTSYPGYGRVSLIRTTSPWQIDYANNVGYNLINISFNARSSLAGTDAIATHWSIGTASTGAGRIIFQAPFTTQGAIWIPCIADSNGDKLAVGADFVLAALPNAALTLPADLDPFEVAPLYNDTLPSALQQSFRYRIKAASQTAAASSKLWTFKLQVENPATVWTDVNFSNTSPCAFQMISAGALTIAVNQIPTIAGQAAFGDLNIQVSG